VERHLALLGVLATVWGALAALVGVSLLLLAAGAFAEVLAPAGLGLAAGLTALAFGLFGVLAVAFGAAHAWSAALMGRRRPSGRILMLALAGVDLLVLPFGTALGVYACWVLLPHAGSRLFTASRKG
jgi:hypothetical protein